MVDWPAVPTMVNLRLISVPAPDIGFPWNAEMIRCPELLAFGVIDIVLLRVPTISYGGTTGCTTVGS